MSKQTRSLSLNQDFARVVSAAQALSGEYELDKMPAAILRTLLQHAQARRGWIYLTDGKQWVAAAGGLVRGRRLQMALPDPAGAAVPAWVVAQLMDHRKPVWVPASWDCLENGSCLENAQASSIPEEQGQPVLYLPLLYQQELIAFLKLETLPETFSPERLDWLVLLADQAAISLSNHRILDELRAAEETARAQELKFRHLFQNTPVGIFEIDISEVLPVIRAANRRAESQFGWTEDEFLKLNPEHLFLPEAGQVFWHLIGAVSRGETAAIETTALRRDGTTFPARMIATPELGPHYKHLVLTVEDITAQNLRRSEAEAIDEERRRMAHEIHDGVAQDLAALRLKISVWHEWIDKCPSAMHAELDQLKQVLDGSMEEIRRSIYGLRPVALEELGFFPALESYLRDVRSQHHLYIDLNIQGQEHRLPHALELPLFRVLQEAMNNIIKHARASLVKVSLDLSQPDRVSLQIQDNGRGFNLDKGTAALRSGHLGLKQMRERVKKADGILTIKSQPALGTEIEVSIPFAAGKDR